MPDLASGLAARSLLTTGGAIPVGGMLKPWGRLGAALVLLAGDAAGLANPVTGAGIAAAVQSGRLAGEAAARGGDAESYRGRARRRLRRGARRARCAAARELLEQSAPATRRCAAAGSPTRSTGNELLRAHVKCARAPRRRAPPIEFRNGARVKAADVPPQGVYQPNYNILTPNMRSPEYVQMSTAAAITLGIMGGRMHRCACTRCLNLLLTYPEGCRANCAYCGLARHREAERDYADRNFIRVDWPAVPLARTIDIVAQGRRGERRSTACASR